MIDEMGRRRESFHEGRSVGVAMSDGAAWLLPRPLLELRPLIRDGRAYGLTRRLTYNDTIDAVIRAIAEADGEGLQALFGVMLAALLLKENYDLTDDECGQIVRYSSDSAESRVMLARVIALATGHIE